MSNLHYPPSNSLQLVFRQFLQQFYMYIVLNIVCTIPTQSKPGHEPTPILKIAILSLAEIIADNCSFFLVLISLLNIMHLSTWEFLTNFQNHCM